MRLGGYRPHLRWPYGATKQVIVSVVNVSEGRDAPLLRQLADACGEALVDVHADADHHRSVFTLVGPRARDAQVAARGLAREVAKHVSIADHEGVHPRLGAVDVVPFVPLTGAASEHEVAVEAAQSFARWWSAAYDVPVFLYGAADPKGRTLLQ